MTTPPARFSGRPVVLVLALLAGLTVAAMYVIRASNQAERERAARLTMPPLEVTLVLECGKPGKLKPISAPRATCPKGSRLFLRRGPADAEVAAVTWALATEQATRGGELNAAGAPIALDLPAEPGESFLVLTVLARRPDGMDPLSVLQPLPAGASVRSRASALRSWAARLKPQGVQARVVMAEIELE